MGSDNCGVTAQSRHEDRTVHRLGVFDVAGVKFCCRHTLRVVSWNRYRTNSLSLCVCVCAVWVALFSLQSQFESILLEKAL